MTQALKTDINNQNDSDYGVSDLIFLDPTIEVLETGLSKFTVSVQGFDDWNFPESEGTVEFGLMEFLYIDGSRNSKKEILYMVDEDNEEAVTTISPFNVFIDELDYDEFADRSFFNIYGRIAVLSKFKMHPYYRNKGLGSKALNEIFKFFYNLGLDFVVVWATPFDVEEQDYMEQEKIKSFYKKNKFTFNGEENIGVVNLNKTEING